MKILTCMYGGEHGYTALKIAGQIAKGTESELTVLYVTERLPERYGTMFHYTTVGPGKTLADMIHGLPELKDTIFAKVDEILQDYGIKAEKKMIEGRKIADAIIEESDRGYDLVILGSAGLSGLERTLFGSVSYEVAEYASIPVLVVKKPNGKIKRILICTDDSESARAGCFFGSTIGKAVGAEVNMLSVAPEFFDKKYAEECDLACALMVKKAVGIDVGKICKGGKGVKGVREEILKEAKNYDLVVCGSRGLSRLQRVRMGHVSLAVKERAETNVLIVRNCILYKKWKKDH